MANMFFDPAQCGYIRGFGHRTIRIEGANPFEMDWLETDRNV